MKFNEYLDKECNNVGQEFWNTWIAQAGIELQAAIKHGYQNLKAKNDWSKEYCEGKVYFAGSWIFFELEEDSVLFTIRWI